MIKEITMFEFNEFAKNHPLHNIYQTSNYAILKAEENFDYDYIGYFSDGTLIAASIILIKKLSFSIKYGYAPRGFLLDYSNTKVLTDFTEKLKKYYSRKKVAFIKIDPLIPIREYNPKDTSVINENLNIIDTFKNLGYKKLKDNLYFESQLPRFECIINLKNNKKYKKNTRNKINKSLTKGLTLEKVSRKQLEIIYKFIQKKSSKSFKYYNNLFKVYDNDLMIDLFLVKVDYEEFMEHSKNNYEKEVELNKEYNEKLKMLTTKNNLNKKMVSDKKLVTYKNEIMEASRKYSDNELTEYIAGAIVIKDGNTINIIESGYDAMYRHLNANYFLYNSIIEYYKNDYDFININAITGDFTHENRYYGLNEFKLGFNPETYEYIGELDLIINNSVYNNLLLTGKLHKEFDLKNETN